MTRFCSYIILLGLILAGKSLALPSDSQQEILFTSKRYTIDGIRQTLTYFGSVQMSQGSLKISAEKMIVFYSENKRVSRIIATGQPAQYSQTPQRGEEPIVAKARRMEYDVKAKNLRLLEDASILQQGASFSGYQLNYNVEKALVEAEGSKQGGSEGRVRMVIPPQQKEESQ